MEDLEQHKLDINFPKGFSSWTTTHAYIVESICLNNIPIFNYIDKVREWTYEFEVKFKGVELEAYDEDWESEVYEFTMKKITK